LCLFCLLKINDTFSQSVGQLPTFNVFDKRISLSGFSSGGTFAQMFQISHSSIIHGIGVFSHTYYRCGEPTGKIDDYDRVCTKLFNLTGSQLYNPDLVHEDIQTYRTEGLIDNTSHLRNRFLYVYTGIRSFLFSTDQSLSILKVYERYIRNPSRIMTRVQDAELVLPTKNSLGTPCLERADNNSFIGNCGFSGPFEMLTFLHSYDHRVLESPGGSNSAQLSRNLREFDQIQFTKGLSNPQLDNTGYYYVPESCKKRKCILHIYFHGCLTGREFEGTKHILNSGYLEVAEASGIIMIFPQAKASEPNNEIGCWDTFGISGRFYATKQGDQVVAVKRILDKAIKSGSVSFDDDDTSSPKYGWTEDYEQQRQGSDKYFHQHQHQHYSTSNPNYSQRRQSSSSSSRPKGYGYYRG